MSSRGASKKINSRQKESEVLEREDFDAGPTNLDCIEPGVWLGNLTAATNVEELQLHHINHILTVDSCPLPRKITMLPGVKVKFLQVTDSPREDLLTHFEDTYEFIKAGQEQGVVLVHCYYGVSRSAAVIIAYIMKKYELSFEDAVERVKSKRRYVGPNPGFVSQLCLYETMKWRMDKTNIQFRMYRLQIAADQVKQARILPQSCMDVVKSDPSLITVKPDPLVYRCRKCRRIVASASNLLPHIPKEKPVWTDKKWSTQGKDTMTLCSETYFVEPLAWMPSITQSLQGKIHCPKCCQCPCGSKISPAFYMVPSKVEWSNMVQNVQVTV
ncbi:dual specificity protein phosphatase MPK-4-like isoform X2 [Zootermopsis nevadensis]|uniref:dual specificity protein phosphatase MPK-4-like isoform X2 n=1 Tax=Zootermopsis nevadensis TaxID=136037 RepID=UPI000B8ED7E5|nr:dual specificity protein phosphatase MPK-4-like isoform X2 [Zootermopsis nevadensis]